MDNGEAVAMVAVASVFAACVFACGMGYGTDVMKAEAVKHGHAEYSQKTGQCSDVKPMRRIPRP